MLTDKPVLIHDADALRRQVLALGEKDGKRFDLWRLLRSSARSAPLSFGWFTPFVALMTRERQDIDNARAIVFNYIDKLEPMSFCSGLQFHFWCFAFPHAKMCLYFQWLCTVGAFSREEIRRVSQALILYHYVNFYYGLRTKPEPECVDNQTLSLAFSCTLVGWLFSQGDQPSNIAKLMLEDGLRRLPEIIGAMPASGYSGEGSAYMDCVNGPAIPLAVELMELITGERGLLHRDFAGNGAKPVHVLEMVARECMPGGLLLPWDNYGYQFGVRAAVAYGAAKTRDPLFFHVLEQECVWSYDIGTGWAYDDLVWTLIWWPFERPEAPFQPSWYKERLGGALTTQDGRYYLMQMWDESAPVIPTRCHVNPNAVLLAGYGVPLSADGCQEKGKRHRFMFEDTWREVSFLAIGEPTAYNYGDGCAGAHSVMLVDGKENLRAMSEYPQTAREQGDPDGRWLMSDAAPIYREHFPDIRTVCRKTQMHLDRFFTIEDWFEAEAGHDVTSRFVLRLGALTAAKGVRLRTPEGVTLSLMDALGGARISSDEVAGYPMKPDGGCRIVDFTSRGETVRRLFVAWISRTLVTDRPVTELSALMDAEKALSPREAEDALQRSGLTLPMRLPAYMEAELPNAPTWWYGKTIRKERRPAYLQLPVGMHAPLLFIDGQPVDLTPFERSMELIAPRVRLPEATDDRDAFSFLLRVDVPADHYAGGGDGTIGMTGGLWLGYGVEEETLQEVDYDGERLTVRTNLASYETRYRLMSGARETEERHEP